MAKAKHPPLYYATYTGPDEYVFVGAGRDRRGYPAGSPTEVGKADADAIRKFVKRKGNDHEFELERVPSELIGTAEENQPTDPGKAHQHNLRLLARDD